MEGCSHRLEAYITGWKPMPQAGRLFTQAGSLCHSWKPMPWYLGWTGDLAASVGGALLLVGAYESDNCYLALAEYGAAFCFVFIQYGFLAFACLFDDLDKRIAVKTNLVEKVKTDELLVTNIGASLPAVVV